MHGLYSKIIKPIHFVGDIAVINASFFLSYSLIYGELDGFVGDRYFSLLIFYNASWFVITSLLKSYGFYRTQSYTALLNDLLKLLFFYILAQEIFSRWITVYEYPHKFFIITYLLIGIFVPLWRVATVFSLRIYRRHGYNYRRVVMVCSDSDSCKDMKEFFDIHPEHGYRLYRIFNIKEIRWGVGNQNVESLPPPQFIDNLKRFCIEKEIDEIYCSYTALDIKHINNIIDFANQNLIRVKFILDGMSFSLKQFKVDFYDYIPVFAIKPTPLDNSLNKIFKRFFDILFSLLTLALFFSWLIPLLAIIIRLDSKGPVFFRQKRSGLNNREFWCLKLRSMQLNEDAHTKQASANDPRITRVGKFLRKHNLDELPQFFNVLIGDMSVVGPRPHMLKHTEEYSQIIEKFMLRHFIKPGITGLSQTAGLRGETQDPAQMRRRVKMDLFYIENWSFLLDIKIIFLTIVNMFRGDKNAG